MTTSFGDDDTTTQFPENPELDSDQEGQTKPSSHGVIVDSMWASLDKPAEAEQTDPKGVRLRPGFGVQFHNQIEYEQLQSWIDIVSKKRKRPDMLRFSQMIIAALCRGIVFKGETMKDESNQPYTFHNAEFKEKCHCLTVGATIEWFYGKGSDGDQLLLGQELLKDCGYAVDEDGNITVTGDDEEGNDPLAD